MQKMSKRRLLISTVLIVAGTCLSIYIAALVTVVRSFDDDATFPVDCAVVFGAAVRRGGEPGPGITRRVSTAADLYHQKYIRTLILTGGKGEPGQASEAAVMKDVALQLGVNKRDIITEDQSNSTWENILYTTELIDECDSIVAISDRYHLARIKLLAHQQGWTDLHTHPASVISTRNFEFKSVLREAVGILYYVVVH